MMVGERMRRDEFSGFECFFEEEKKSETTNKMLLSAEEGEKNGIFLKSDLIHRQENERMNRK